MLALSVPVLFSLIAEPLTGLADTAFVARLGAEALAALGVGTAALSSIFWIFNFLGIGTQTEVAQAMGRDNEARASRMVYLALGMALAIGTVMVLIGQPLMRPATQLLGAQGSVADQAATYMRVRLFGAPAVLTLLVIFGALRGVQDMRTPLWIALTLNAINIALDALLVTGPGPIPALGIAGVAIASVIAQWIGALWGLVVIRRAFPLPQRIDLSESRRLLRVGGDLFIRTAMLNLYLLLTTRVVTSASAEAGAAHQAIRQFWIFTALGLDALAITAQSLVGFFIGGDAVAQARQVARVACLWGLALGLVLGISMIAGEGAIARLLVPSSALLLFQAAWPIAALAQPLNALAFVTDGVHWGTGDFRYLRNAVIISSVIGGAALLLVDQQSPAALVWVWLITGFWIALRAGLGVIRIWPGIGQAPLRISIRPVHPGPQA
jgi:MATE family multidrug resistance protein